MAELDSFDQDSPYFDDQYVVAREGVDTRNVPWQLLKNSRLGYKGVRAWTAPYAPEDQDSTSRFSRTLQLVVRPSDDRIHLGFMRGDRAAGDTMSYQVRVRVENETDPTIDNESDPTAYFDTGTSGTTSSIFGGSGGTLSFNDPDGDGNDEEALWSGSVGAGSEAAELVLVNFTEETQVTFEVEDFSDEELRALTAGATVIETSETLREATNATARTATFSTSTPYVLVKEPRRKGRIEGRAIDSSDTDVFSARRVIAQSGQPGSSQGENGDIYIQLD